jgi:hypothetical protein
MENIQHKKTRLPLEKKATNVKDFWYVKKIIIDMRKRVH